MQIFFSVGEPSGDLHGANLIRELRRIDNTIDCVGFGGPKMRSAGCSLHEDLTRFAVMWFSRVLLNLHHFLRMYRQAGKYFREQRPDAVVLIDYPGFNWWIARAAKRNGIPVFYYGVPQIWAWAGWRIKKMRRLIDHTLCKLPFEEAWYRERGCRATYIGHPFFDETSNHQVDTPFLALQQADARPLVAILPGSRSQEVANNLQMFVRAAEIVFQSRPDVRFAIASFNEHQAEAARAIVGDVPLPIEIHVGKTPELIRAATCCMACSGSVSLELLYYEKPTVILYAISRLAYAVQARFRRVQYITLVNMFEAKNLFPKRVTPYDPHAPEAAEVPFPEYVTCADKSYQIAAHITDWLGRDSLLEGRITKLRELKQKFAKPGASARAAEYIVDALSVTTETRAAA